MECDVPETVNSRHRPVHFLPLLRFWPTAYSTALRHPGAPVVVGAGCRAVSGTVSATLMRAAKISKLLV